MKTRWQWVGASLLLAAPSWADVITVDDSGGADYTSLPEAVAAASPGDTLLVAAGTYSAFLLAGKPLTIMGLEPGQVLVQGTSRVTEVVAPARVVLCQLDFERLALSASSGTLVLDQVVVLGTKVERLSIGACNDVRAIGLVVEAFAQVETTADPLPIACLAADASRFEIVESYLRGRKSPSYQWNGESALAAEGGTRLYCASSTLVGGIGGDDPDGPCGPWICSGCDGSWGGPGLMVLGPGSTARISGYAGDIIEGGNAGNPSYCYGYACAIYAKDQGIAEHSGVTLKGKTGPTYCMLNGGVVNQLQWPEPFLTREQTPLAGGQARFYAHGIPGDVVTLFVGRNAVVVPLTGVSVEQLTSQERSFELGVIDASGVVSFAMTVPPSLPPGFCFFGQARILRQGWELRTNSVPIVLR
jgi:hypothetical protein